MTGDRLAFAAITTLYLVVAIPWEERSLVRSFGDDYARYTRAGAVADHPVHLLKRESSSSPPA